MRGADKSNRSNDVPIGQVKFSIKQHPSVSSRHLLNALRKVHSMYSILEMIGNGDSQKYALWKIMSCDTFWSAVVRIYIGYMHSVHFSFQSLI